MSLFYDNIKDILPYPCKLCVNFWEDLKLCKLHKKFSFDESFKEIDKNECYEKIEITCVDCYTLRNRRNLYE